MSAQFMALVVLVKLFGVGQAAHFDHIHDSISHEPAQTDGMSKNARLGEMTLKNFTWTYSSTDSRTSLTVCTEESFLAAGQTFKQVTLLTVIDDNPEKNCEGEFDADGQHCATFTGADNCDVDVPSGDVKYTLEVFVTVLQLTNVNKSGTASFTMTVEAATLTCGSIRFIRATGIKDAMTATCEAPGVNGVCYQGGDLAIEPFCFADSASDPPELTLCLGGDNQFDQAADGELIITQLAYTQAGSATLSLTHSVSDSTPFEAIVLKDETPLQSCDVTPVAESSGTCTISDFTRSDAKYDVCTIIPGPIVSQTALSSITDLDVQAGEDTSSLQFRFTNANPVRKYVAKLDNDPSEDDPPTANLDCTGVTQNHICYGLLEQNALYTYLTIEYLTADEITSNKISIANPGFPAEN